MCETHRERQTVTRIRHGEREREKRWRQTNITHEREEDSV